MTSPWSLCRGERMQLPDFQPMTKGAQRGSCRVQLPSGLVIQDGAVFVGRRRAWANLPTKAWIGQDYRQKTNVNGKPAHLPVLEWRNRGLADRLSEAVVTLIRRARPGDPRRLSCHDFRSSGDRRRLVALTQAEGPR
jgi:hypothetical protein